MIQQVQGSAGRFLLAVAMFAVALVIVPAGAANAETKPAVQLSRSSVIVFEVRHKQPMYNAEQFGGAPVKGIQLIAQNTGRYAAVYFPAAQSGWVQVQDPSEPKDLPLVAPIGKVRQWGFTFKPHHRYWMIVALDKPGRVVFPNADYRILDIRHRQVIKVGLTVRRLPVPSGSSRAVAGYAPIDLASSQASMVAISVHYDHATSRVVNGDACAATTPAGGCSLDRAGSFRTGWWTPGSHGQDAVGRAYTSGPTGGYMTGDYEVLDGSPFQSARLIAFGLQIDQ